MNSNVIFNEIQSNWRNIYDPDIDIFNYDKLRTRYGSEEFDQMLSSLWFQTGYVIYRLEIQLEKINELRIYLEGKINKDYRVKK